MAQRAVGHKNIRWIPISSDGKKQRRPVLRSLKKGNNILRVAGTLPASINPRGVLQ
jgi:hypothetical protein